MPVQLLTRQPGHYADPSHGGRQQYVQGLVETSRAAYKASQTRNVEAVSEVTNQISDACANCHRVYRDLASNTMRCTGMQ